MRSKSQVLALVALRWSMVRSPGVRAGLLAAVSVAVGTLVALALAGSSVPLGRATVADVSAGDFLGRAVDRTGEVGALLPPVLLAFLALAVVAPVAAGGGYDLVPDSQLVAYPVRVRTLVRGSLLLSPLNVAWYVQVLVIALATSYAVRGPGAPYLSLGLVAAYLLAATVVGQALGWLLVGVRRTRRGRASTWVLLALVLALVGWTVVTDRMAGVLETLPTSAVVSAAQDAARLDPRSLPAVLVLGLVTVLAYLGAVRAADWALRRPGDLGIDGPAARPVRRRATAATPYRALLEVDRASVWRSQPLRRGILVLAVLPVVAALVAGLPWSSIALLGPLVASGAALLFGVNALSLDGSGAVWIASLPQDPLVVLRSKARVVTEVVAGSVVVVLVGAGLRSGSWPDLQQATSVVAGSVACTALVVATCLRLSVVRPHRADLRGPRDTPAPPGTMALYSIRLALLTTPVALVFAVLTVGPTPAAPVLGAALCLAWARWSWRGTRRRWLDADTRARVVSTVAAG